MTRAELEAEILRMRPHIKNVIFFHDLIEREDVSLTPLKKTVYGAYVYASGVALAEGVQHLINAMDEGSE